MSQTFGQYIRALREKAGLTQRALSQAVGFRSLAHLSDIESGKRHPSRETLPKFAEALGVRLEELEIRDVRSPVDAVKALFAARPEMIGAFSKVVELARTMDADELVRRVSRGEEPKPAKQEPSPAPIVAPTPPTPVPQAPPPTVEPPRPIETPTPSAPEFVPAPAPHLSPEAREIESPAPKKAASEKNIRDDQPRLF